MNSSSRVPPRFVPTLTAVVEPETDAKKSADVTEVGQDAVSEPDVPVALSVHAELPPRPSFHSPWLSDGAGMRSKPATIPHELPPLPEALPPQQPFANTAVREVSSDARESLASQTDVGPEVLERLQAYPSQGLPLVLESTADHEEGLAAALANDEHGLGQGEEIKSALPADAAYGNPASEEYLIQRVLERVDLILESRLQEAVAQVMQAQASSIALHLRKEVETVIRQAVCDAVASDAVFQAKRSVDAAQ